MDLKFHSPFPTLGHVTWWYEKRKFNFAVHGTVFTEGFMSQQRNVCHHLETPHMTRFFLFLLRQRSGYILVSFLLFIERGCHCAGYIYIYM
jgi:hypothetical protein